MPTFRYDAEILARYPHLSGGVILAEGMTNRPTPPALAELYLAEQRATIESIGSKPLSELESLSAWRGAFRQFGTDPTKYRSAPESLLRRLTKKGDIPLINTLVDSGNLVSIKYGLPVAVFDMRALQGAVTVHIATGRERYTPLGESAIEHPEPGEVVFADETGLVIARRWCWRQSEESAARLDTQNAIITVEGQHVGGEVAVRAALQDLLKLLQTYASGQFTFDILGREKPELTA